MRPHEIQQLKEDCARMIGIAGAAGLMIGFIIGYVVARI
jgi:uncharacterized membrane-anchored protein YhcB (DUF1043 family)